MGNWLKQNWFKIAIVIFIIASLPIILSRYGIQIVPPIPITLGPNPIQSSSIEVGVTCNENISGWQIGTGDHSPSSVSLTSISGKTSYLKTPRDLAFNPEVIGDLWVINGADNSIAIIHQAHTNDRSIEYRKVAVSGHFMHRPSAIAFGGNDTTFGKGITFATAQESINNGYPFVSRIAPNFMGPTLYSSGLYAKLSKRPKGNHLDMLHESPLAMGIAWEKDNAYWVFGGHFNDIVRFDFALPHEPGTSDHSGGVIKHYVTGQVKRYPNVPSHLAFHNESKMLFIADTANSRVLKLDTTTGSLGEEFAGPEEGVESHYVGNANLIEFISPNAGLSLPSGLEIQDEIVFISDHATGIIHAYDMEGNQVNYLDTGLGENVLMGTAFGPNGRLYLVDSVNDEILRVDCR